MLWMLGINIFLCTTGAGHFRRLGHCGKGNIRISATVIRKICFDNKLSWAGCLVAGISFRQGATSKRITGMQDLIHFGMG